jgi:hypothetical protein
MAFALALGVAAWDAWGRGKGQTLVVFRLDDYSPWFPLSLGHSLTNVCGRYGIPVHLSVVPASGRESATGAYRSLSPDLVAFLAREAKAGHFEVSLHGLLHERLPDGGQSEFGSLPPEKQVRRMQTGFDMVVRDYGLKPVALVPPWHGWDPATLDAMLQVGIPVLSARAVPQDWEAVLSPEQKALHYLPALAGTLSFHRVARLAAETGDPHALVIAMTHPGDFGGWEEGDFLAYFGALLAIPGARVVRMGDVVKEEPGFTLQHWFDWSRAVHRWDTRRSRMKRLGMDFDNLFPAGVYASPRHLGNVAFRYYARLSVFWTFVTTLALVAAKLACGVMAARVARRQTGTWRGPSGHSENC